MSQELIVRTQNEISELTAKLRAAEGQLYFLQSLADNNRFDSMEVAETAIYSKLKAEANEDCEGSYNCGNPQYHQEFYVNDQLYIGVLDVEYNRHDKTYYYVEESTFTVKKLEEE